MIFATQIHPHDVRDEGAVAVARNISELAACPVVGAEISTLEERHPYPHGELPHNPRRNVVVTHARHETPLEIPTDLGFRPVLSEEAISGFDYVAQISQAGQKAGLSVIPWIKALNIELEGDWQQACVVTAGGRVVRNWLCPSKPTTEQYVRSYVRYIVSRYSPRAVLVDRLRYPDWSGAQVDPSSLFTCFCPDCKALMASYGIDTSHVRASLKRLGDSFIAGTDATTIAHDDQLRLWMKFRQDRITRLAQIIQDEIGSMTTVWLNLWPPSFAPWMGQDYSSLGRVCHGAKHFPYHKLGGGADLSGLVRRLAGMGVESPERVFRSVMDLLELPYSLSLAEFEEHGLPVDYVQHETANAVRMFKATPIYTGVQIWDIPASEIEAATEAAASGGASGFFFYCYGWATLDALAEVGRIARRQ